MNVTGFSTDDKLTVPFPDDRFVGMKLRLLQGDVYDPIGPWDRREDKLLDQEDTWFNSLPASAHRALVDAPVLPFFSVGLGPFGFYVGWKVYGFDAPEYLDFPGVQREDVYPGSLAMCLSIRFTTNRPRRQS